MPEQQTFLSLEVIFVHFNPAVLVGERAFPDEKSGALIGGVTWSRPNFITTSSLVSSWVKMASRVSPRTSMRLWRKQVCMPRSAATFSSAFRYFATPKIAGVALA